MHAIRQTQPLQTQATTQADGFSRAPLTAAVLSDRPTTLVAALAARSITAIDATDCDLALLLRDAPDMLVIDLAPAHMPGRRIALLVQQLGWLRRDLVIAVSRRTAPRTHGFTIDLIFDAEADAETLADRFHDAARLLAHSRLRPVADAAPRTKLLRHRPARRRNLFG